MTITVTRLDFPVAELRRRARLSDDADQARRILAIALVLEGGSRGAAARAVAAVAGAALARPHLDPVGVRLDSAAFGVDDVDESDEAALSPGVIAAFVDAEIEQRGIVDAEPLYDRRTQHLAADFAGVGIHGQRQFGDADQRDFLRNASL